MRRCLLGALLLLCTPAWGLAEYYSLSRSIRALGMGNAFYGLSDDEGALFYNPAALARYDGGGQFFVGAQAYLGTDFLSSLSTVTDSLSGADTADIVAGMSGIQGNFNSAGVHAMPFLLFRGFALGVLIGDLKGNLALLGRDLDTEVDITAINDSGVFVAKSFSFGKRFSLGVTGKFIHRVGGRTTLSVLDIVLQTPFEVEDLGGSGSAVDFDLGMNYEFAKAPLGRRFGVGAVLHNVFASDFGSASSLTAPPGLVRSFSAGAYTFFKNGMSLRLDLAEFNLGGETDPDLGSRGGSFFKHINLGWEYGLGRFALRAGLYQGQLTAGFGFQLPFMKLDFATFGEELGRTPGNFSSRRLALRLAFGLGFVPRQPYNGGRG